MSRDTENAYLYVLPLQGDMIDMFAVFNRIYPQITKWVELFTNQATWETDIHAEYNNTELLRHFYFSSKNHVKTNGQHTFGFGFPLVVDRDTEGVITAPLFVWYLNMRPHPNRKDSWLISFDDNNVIAVNDYLVHHIRAKYDVDIRDILNDYVHNRPFTAHGFDAFCKELAHTIGLTNTNINAGIRECPHGNNLEQLADTGDIVWSGILGLFPHQEGGLSTSYDIQSIDLQNFTWTAEHAHEFAVLPEDAYQREALRTVLRNKITVVEGAHGTGKTHLAANILLNALSNGQKTAVVANDIGSLMQIQNALVNLGLGNLTFLLKDLYHDKKLLLDVLRNEQYGKTIEFKEEDFKIALKQARRLLAKSDDSHEALSNPIFGDKPFSEVVGLYLASQRVEGRELLDNHLPPNDFEFSQDEYEQLKAAIKDCEVAYRNVYTLKHPLSQLHPSIFEAGKSNEGRSLANKHLTDNIGKWKNLHHQYIVTYDAYTQKLMTHYEAYYEDLRAQLRLIKEAYSDYQYQFGDDFENNGFFKMGGLRAASLFSDRSKNVLSAKEGLTNQYDTLEKIYTSKRYFAHSFLNIADRKDFKKLKLNLETFELCLKGWRKSLSATVQEELQRLNAKTAQYLDKALSNDIKKLEEDLEGLVKFTNENALYATPISHKMLTLPKRMLFIEDTIEKLEETQLNMRDFDIFYTWQHYWLQLPDKGRKLVQALVKVKPNDWQAAFSSWYLHHVLVAHYQSNTLNNDELMSQMNEAEEKLRPYLPAQIGHQWNDRRKEGIKAFKSKNTEGYKLFFTSQNQRLAKNRFLKDILKNAIGTLSEIYPVLLLTPQVASQITEGEGKEFDLIVFDNAQSLNYEQVAPILQNTEGVVVLTEYSKTDGLSANSLALKLKAHGAATIRLNHLHRPLSETARRLNQTVFYPTLEIPFRPKTVEQSVTVNHLANARYNDKTDVNDAEIIEIIRLLEEIHATPFNTFPRIGVVCLTTKQRNALSSALLNIVQKSLFGFDKIEQLQRNGLGVFTIDEITGLQFDVLVVSGTYTDIEKMPLSLRDLRELLNSFTQNLYWINSILKNNLAEATLDSKNQGTFLISNLIELADRTKAKGSVPYHAVFERLSTLSPKPFITDSSKFVHEVMEGLSRHIEKKYMRTNFDIENQIFPLVIIPKYETQLPIVVRIDGKLTQSKGFNPSWEARTLRELEKMGLPVVSIWSYNWWKNPKHEAFELAKAIFAYDKVHEPKAEQSVDIEG